LEQICYILSHHGSKQAKGCCIFATAFSSLYRNRLLKGIIITAHCNYAGNGAFPLTSKTTPLEEPVLRNLIFRAVKDAIRAVKGFG